jgi:predicted AlkP superfamily pyrophosphatase or phosphodiesterase
MTIPRFRGLARGTCLASLLSGVVASAPPAPRPKLVVVIVIDQFRPDYLQRFRSHFGKGGFNLFFEQGANFDQARYRHGVTQTCPGHAVILTGSYADVNGIIANSWYDAAARREEYCAADTLVRLIGAGSEGRSPRNLIDSTVGDQLKLATAGRSRVITVSGKDRSAIMLGGHLADAAYWTDDTLVVSSTYYMKELPEWVRRFNASGAVSSYVGQSWERLLAPAAYGMVGPDDVAAEENIAGMGRTFPHRLGKRLDKRFVNAFEASPFQNDVIVDFAMQAVVEEGLGLDQDPDLLAIGFSANDRIGHAYGPDSHEVMDVTVRTDRLLERFFSFLAKQVGLENVLVVLTSDHGVAPLPELVPQLYAGVTAGRIDPSVLAAAAEKALRARFGAARKPGWIVNPGWIVYQGWPSLYFNIRGLQDRGVPVDQAERVAKAAVEKVAGVQQVLTATELERERKDAVHSSAELSFYPTRSGNIYYVLRPYWLPETQPVGTTHGSPWDYDTHVPILWFGQGIVPGTRHDDVSVADIAPTLAVLLGIGQPTGTEGRVLKEILR